MDASYCARCTAMFDFVNTGEAVWNSHREEYWRQVPQYEKLCHYRFNDVGTAASKGCPLCSKLQAWTAKHTSHSEHAGLDFSAEPMASESGTWKLRFGVSGGDGEKRLNDDASSLLTFTCHPLETQQFPTDREVDELYRGFANSDTSLQSTGSERSLGRIKRWMETCLKSHKTCDTDSGPSVYPPRLLDVRNSKVKLVLDTTSMKAQGIPYAALSHSWGPNPQQLILTTDNQFKLGHHITDDDLPPTFRDAITVTRALGIDYLWIDSLCIIQAGQQHVGDWLGHSAIMGSIYQNCVINIAAAHGHDARAGCFVNRNVPQIAPCIVDLRRVTKIGNPEEDDFGVEREKQLTPHMLVPEPLLSENVAHFHLDTRAWVCQERLLSPRTIYFSSTQLFWECSESENVCEGVPLGVQRQILPKPDVFPYMGEAIGQDFSWGTMQFEEGSIPPFNWRAPDSGEQYEWWLKTLHGYVRRNLTKSSDKLPALGGIAERTAKVLGDEYLAGLFRDKLPDALLWSCVQERRPRMQRDKEQQFAPSWSWASTNGDIDFTPLTEENARTICEVLDCKVELVDMTNKFGQVREALLTLRGPFATFAKKLVDDDENWVYHFAESKVDGFASKKQLLYFDFDPCTLEVEKLGLLLVRENARPYTYPGSGDMEEAGLVVSPIVGDERERWMRVGVWKGVEYDFEDSRDHKYENVAVLTLA